MKILIRLVFALGGVVIGLIIGVIVAWIIAWLITPEEQEPTLMFVIIFAVITSQIGLIFGPYLALPLLNKTRWRVSESQQKSAPNPSGPVR